MLIRPRHGATRSLTGRAAASGFTLIELIVTFTLLGILVALSLPSFTAWIRNSQVRTVAEAVQSGLRTAQAEAVRRNQAVALSFTNDANPQLNPTVVANGRNWSLQTVASPFTNGGAAEWISSGVLSDVASGVSITGPAAVCFDANGRVVMLPAPSNCTANSQTVDVSFPPSADRPLRVLVAVGGQVRMCDPARTLSATTPDGCP